MVFIEISLCWYLGQKYSCTPNMECSGRGGGPALLWTFRLHTNQLTAHQPIDCTPTKLPNFDLLHTLLDCCTPSWMHTLLTSFTPSRLTAHPPHWLHTLQTYCTPSTPDLLHTLRPAAHPPKSHKSAGPPPLTLHSILVPRLQDVNDQIKNIPSRKCFKEH